MTARKCEVQTAWDVEERRLVFAPWQCACTRLTRREGIPDKKITWPLFPTVPTHLTWPPAISTCSRKWNSSWKGGASYPLKRSKQNRNRY